MGIDKNFLFEAFEKIVWRTGKIDNGDDNIIEESESFHFVSLKAVKLSDAQNLIKDLEKLIEKLNDAVARIYRYGNETEAYEKLVKELKVKHDRLRYLTSYFVDTRKKIEAARLKLDEMELELSNKEERRKNIERQISELEEKRKKNLKKMKKQNLRKERKGKKAEPEHDVILHLSPIRRTETNSNPSQSTTTATVDTSDFHSVD